MLHLSLKQLYDTTSTWVASFKGNIECISTLPQTKSNWERFKINKATFFLQIFWVHYFVYKLNFIKKNIKIIKDASL